MLVVKGSVLLLRLQTRQTPELLSSVLDLFIMSTSLGTLIFLSPILEADAS